jgi:methionyl-tRNA synthetase
MEVVNIKKVKKKRIEKHGEVLFQRILGRGTNKPDLMSTISGLSRITIPPGESNKIHVHEKEEQIYIIIRGEGIIQVGDEFKHVKSSDVIYLPPRKPHGFRNNTNQNCILLNFGAQTIKNEIEENNK